MPRLREWKWDSWADWAVKEIGGGGPQLLAVDTETTGLEYYDEPFAATLSWRGLDGSLQSAYFDLEGEGREERIAKLRAALKMAPAWVFHNAKFDLQKLLLIGAIDEIDLERTELHDTQTIYHLLDENGRKGLKHLAVYVLKYDDTIQVPYTSGQKKGQFRPVSREKYVLDRARRKLKLRKEDGYHLLPREIVVPYAMRDTEFTLRLYEKLMPKLEGKNDPNLLRLYADSMELKLVLLRMEADAFALDLDYLNQQASEYGVKVMESWQRVTMLAGNHNLNPQSPAQLQDVFAEIGTPMESTDVDHLKALIEKHPEAKASQLARALLEYRNVKKVHQTYLVGIQKAQRDGLIHPSFNDDGARTGRMSSGSPTNN